MYQPHDKVKICMMRDQIRDYIERADECDKPYWEMMLSIICIILGGASRGNEDGEETDS